MAVRLTLGLAALLCLAGMVAASWPQPRISEPSKLERSCWVRTIYVPCFLLDEYAQTEFNV